MKFLFTFFRRKSSVTNSTAKNRDDITVNSFVAKNTIVQPNQRRKVISFLKKFFIVITFNLFLGYIYENLPLILQNFGSCQFPCALQSNVT